MELSPLIQMNTNSNAAMAKAVMRILRMLVLLLFGVVSVHLIARGEQTMRKPGCPQADYMQKENEKWVDETCRAEMLVAVTR
jgi:hypothetical protein